VSIGVHSKYARIEHERRFLLRQLPAEFAAAPRRELFDRYITGTRLRLREQRDDDAPAVYKLTQKVGQPNTGYRQGWITTMLLEEREFRALAQLAADTITKTRYRLPPLCADVFAGRLVGLVLAEAEFASREEACDFQAPAFAVAEVSENERFTGGKLAAATRTEVESWLAAFDLGLG